MAGNRSMACAEGTPLPGEGEEEGEGQFQGAANCPNPSPSSSPLVARGEATEPARARAIPILWGGPRAQYPVVAPVGNPFKLCYFPLVTPESLLY